MKIAKSQCSFPGCEKPYRNKNYCAGHLRLLRNGMSLRPLTAEARFWSFVDKTDTCWFWTKRTQRGYGRFKTKAGDKLAHRVAWELVNGPILPGVSLDHLCRNKHCVRPEHLEITTFAENTKRMLAYRNILLENEELKREIKRLRGE